MTGIKFDKTQKSIDFMSPSANNVLNVNYQRKESDQDYQDDFEAYE